MYALLEAVKDYQFTLEGKMQPSPNIYFAYLEYGNLRKFHPNTEQNSGLGVYMHGEAMKWVHM